MLAEVKGLKSCWVGAFGKGEAGGSEGEELTGVGRVISSIRRDEGQYHSLDSPRGEMGLGAGAGE